MRRSLLLAATFLFACTSTPSTNTDGGTDGGPTFTTPVSSVTLTATIPATPKILSNPVDVVRDQWGIPHIYGQSIPDVAYAQGYFMAMDRWIELDQLRRDADGSLSVVFGAGELPFDVGMRLHHLRKTAEAGLAALQASTDPADMLLVQGLVSFAAGVNAWQADLNAGKYSLPSGLLTLYNNASVQPWLPEDSLLIGEFLAWDLSFDSTADVARTNIDLAVAQTFPAGDPRANIAADLENTIPTDPAGVIDGGWNFNINNTLARRDAKEPKKLRDWKRSKAGKALRKLLDGDLRSLALAGPQPSQQIHGSNNWVIGPQLSATGHVLVSNDTHLPLQNPPIFYMNHLVVPDAGSTPLNVMGEQFPGVPLVTLGMNQHAAWGATVSFIDVTDMFRIAVSPCGSNFCTTFNGQSVQLVPRTESFDVGQQGNVMKSAVTVTYYDDPNHGPLMPRIKVDPTNPLKVTLDPLGSTEISIKYTGYTSAPLLKAIVGLDLAADMPTAVAAIDKNFRYGGQNWVIGDDQGNYGWTQALQVPVRNVPAGQSTIVPYKVMPGDGTAEWAAGSMDPYFIPHAFNHPQGYISTANNDPIGTCLQNNPFYGQPLYDGGTSHLYLGVDYDPGTREARIENRINSIVNDGGKLTLDDMSSIQADAVTEYGQMMSQIFIDASGALAAAAAGGTGDGGPSDVTAYAWDAGTLVQGMFSQVNGWVSNWSFDTPSGVSDPDAGAPTAKEVSDSQAALIMGVFSQNFLHQTLDDELAKMGSGGQPLLLPTIQFAETPLRLATHPETSMAISPITGDPIEFDDLNTPGIIESKRQIAARTIVVALNFIISQLGPTSANWRWGQLHTLTLNFNPPGLGLNIPPTTDPVYPNGFARHGAAGTVDVGGETVSPTDFTYAQGPAIRFTCELDPVNGPHGRNVLPGGEIFDPKSPHYRDQMELWRKNQTIDWAYQDADVVKSAQVEYTTNKIGRTRFTP